MSIKADRVFNNAKVYSVSMDGKETRAQAVAVKDGKIVFVGTDEQAGKWIGPDTEVCDCHGGSLLPGFGDAHMHFSISVRRFGVVDLNSIVSDYSKTTPDEVIEIIRKRVKDFAEIHPDAAVIHGSGWDRAWFTGALQGIARPFTRHDIDAVVPDKPVVLDSFCGHVCLLNSKALELAGVTKDYPDPQGLIRKDKDGNPDGYIQEPVMIAPICEAIPGFQFSDEEFKNGMLDAQKLFISRGYTLVADCMKTDAAYKALMELAESDRLRMRVRGVFNCNNATAKKDLEYAVANRNKFNCDDVMGIDTVKYFVDGNLAMCEPYSPEYCKKAGIPEDYRDPLLWKEEDLMKSMEDFQKAGFNIHVHAMGDYGLKYTVDCMENAQRKYNKDGKLRNIIAHCSYVKDEDKKRMGDNHIIASIQPEWESENGESGSELARMLGVERHRRTYPNKSLVDAGVVCAYGSDFTVGLPDALAGIQTALTRRICQTNVLYEAYKNTKPYMPEECVTLKEAIKAHTINTAYQFHLENITGSIETGKSAELVILDKDIEAVPANEICLIKVVETVFKGETVFKAEP